MTKEEMDTLHRAFEIIKRQEDEVAEYFKEQSGDISDFRKMKNFYEMMIDFLKRKVNENF